MEAAAEPSPHELPYVAVQPSLPHVLADIAAPNSSIAVENAWISVYTAHGRSVHARVRVSEGDDDSVHVDSLHPAQLSVQLHSHGELAVACPELDIPLTTVLLPSPRLNPALPLSSSRNPTTLEAPAPAFVSFRTGGVDCFALSPDGRRVVVGGKDGHARVVELAPFADGSIRAGKETPLRGHVGDLVACAFAPSGEAVLTAGADMTVRVFSALDGSSPRVAALPPRRLTSLTPLLSAPSTSRPAHHKGRHLLAGSLSGALTLLDVSPNPPATIRSWMLPAPVTACCVLLRARDEDPRDVTRGRYALVGCTDGAVRAVPLFVPREEEEEKPRVVFRVPGGGGAISALDACADSEGGESYTVAVGTQDGLVSVFRLPAAALPSEQPGQSGEFEPVDPVATWRRSGTLDSAICGVALSPRMRTSAAPSSSPPSSSTAQTLLVAPASGAAYRALLPLPRSDTDPGAAPRACVRVTVAEEFTGLDCEHATAIAEDASGRVWVSGGGAVRVYERGVVGAA